MKQRKRVLAVASGGGHWIQLMRLKQVLQEFNVEFVTTISGLGHSCPGFRTHIVRDASRTDKIGLIILLVSLFRVIATVRPHVIVTTGAAPGLLAVQIGKVFGVKTIWIDSIANTEELSLSGRMAGRWADLWLTQWPHLVERPSRLQYKGAVI